MIAPPNRMHRGFLLPLYAILLAGTVPLFVGALLGDVAYSLSYELQWKNFASWLIVGGLVFGGFALLWPFFGLFRRDPGRRRAAILFLLLLAMWGVGFINALVHAMDAWASMPEAVVLSAVGALFAIMAAIVGLSALRLGEME